MGLDLGIRQQSGPGVWLDWKALGANSATLVVTHYLLLINLKFRSSVYVACEGLKKIGVQWYKLNEENPPIDEKELMKRMSHMSPVA